MDYKCDNERCLSCMYVGGHKSHRPSCDYILIEGHSRGCNVLNCAENLKRFFDIKGAKFEAESIVKTIDRMPGYQRKDISMSTRPNYYKGEIECWTAIKAAVEDKEGYEGFLIGNIIKYLWRYEEKGGYEDICKAGEYLEELKRAYKKRTIAHPTEKGV